MPIKIHIEGVFPEKDVMRKKGNRILQAVEDALRNDVSDLVIRAMENRVDGWNKSPRFSSKFYSLATRIGVLIEPTGSGKKYWVMVSAGTPRHLIAARRAKALSIRTGYTAKTAPNNVYGRSGAYSGEVIYKPSVVHPGIKPRRFEYHIKRDLEGQIGRIIQDAVTKAAK